jgi:hypothetical protein
MQNWRNMRIRMRGGERYKEHEEKRGIREKE